MTLLDLQALPPERDPKGGDQAAAQSHLSITGCAADSGLSLLLCD
ncbi:SapB/AmfS family lanthipeptide [Actinomadura sp. ATCC 31491]|uniref:SapB/AmfS family lanthipeptide n=1 Tax=Actinomadura luzonensis TaxID=2805427 RepID=A0ABT0FMS4_9ACTN|nr:SapB/AmfS family lanthipeptide [Actinomadura luzonensis]MCK2213639.1 SapB/AmfS family lanthipeptide [Actinomadura luzonensis]